MSEDQLGYVYIHEKCGKRTTRPSPKGGMHYCVECGSVPATEVKRVPVVSITTPLDSTTHAM